MLDVKSLDCWYGELPSHLLLTQVKEAARQTESLRDDKISLDYLFLWFPFPA